MPVRRRLSVPEPARRRPPMVIHCADMSRKHTERRLRETATRLQRLRTDLDIADEQVAHFVDEADESRLRALVSETPDAQRDHRDAQRHAEAMCRHRDRVVSEITELEQAQDQLLDRLQELSR